MTLRHSTLPADWHALSLKRGEILSFGLRTPKQKTKIVVAEISIFPFIFSTGGFPQGSSLLYCFGASHPEHVAKQSPRQRPPKPQRPQKPQTQTNVFKQISAQPPSRPVRPVHPVRSEPSTNRPAGLIHPNTRSATPGGLYWSWKRRQGADPGLCFSNTRRKQDNERQ